jgi:hypothetical protein
VCLDLSERPAGAVSKGALSNNGLRNLACSPEASIEVSTPVSNGVSLDPLTSVETRKGARRGCEFLQSHARQFVRSTPWLFGESSNHLQRDIYYIIGKYARCPL